MSENSISAPEANETPDALIALTARLDAAEARSANAETRYHRSERRFRVLSGALLGGLILVTSLPFAVPAVAQGFSITLKQLADKVAALETKTASMSVITDPNTNQPTVRFSNVNVQVVSGSGTTDGTVNGRGNLIVGYNESTAAGNTGSHNIIGGRGNVYSAYGAIVVGQSNVSAGNYASVLGGSQNVARGVFSVVCGGNGNDAGGPELGGFTAILGGQFNIARGVVSTVSGGQSHDARGQWSAISGGRANRTGDNATWGVVSAGNQIINGNSEYYWGHPLF